MTSSDTQAGNRLIHRLLLGRNFWIGPTALLFLAQLCVVKLLGERNSGAVATNIVQICVQILGICVFLRTARASHSLARYFWLLAVFSSLVFSIGLALAISAQFLALSPNVPSWADAIFVFFFGPVSLTLFLEPDFEHRRFDRIHILDFTQVLLFCIAVYLFWQYSTRIFPAASSGHDWFRESWVGIFLWDGVLAGTFLLRAVLADSRLVRALFGRIGCYLVFNCLADLLYDRYFQNLPTGSWYEIIWTAIAIIPIAIAGAWNDAKFEERSSSAQRGNRINASLFPTLFAFLVLSLCILMVGVLPWVAVTLVAISFVCSSGRLIIVQWRQDHTLTELRAQILERQRIERLLVEHGETLEARVAERTAKLEESKVAIEEAERRLERLADNLPSGMVYQLLREPDGEKLFLYVSAGVEKLHSLTPESVLRDASLLYEQIVVEDREILAAEEEKSLREMSPFSVEVRFKTASGDYRWASLSSAPRSSSNGGTVWDGIEIDVTDKKHIEEQLRRAQRMEAMGQLAGGVAHDFNNLLMIASANVELLEKAKQNPQRVDRYLEQIRNATDRGAALTRQMLAFSRQQVLSASVLNLNTVITDLWKMLDRLLGEDIETVLDLDPNLGFISADHGQLEQVIMNLAVNARDAMPNGGKLTVKTRNVELKGSKSEDTPSGPCVLSSVSDTGTGMPPDVQARIFDPFFTTKELGKGTGLGLATVYGIVKQSGGSISVHSEVGKGSTFNVYLPRVEASETAEPPSQDHSAPNGAETILLVEDEGALRAVTSEYLRAMGYHVLEASNGAEALEVCEAHAAPIHVVITDIVMPASNGFDVAKEVAARRPTVRTILMSGYSDRMVHPVSLQPNVAFLQKPFKLDALARKIHAMLNARQ